MTIHFSNDTFVRDRQKTELRIAARLLADIYAGPHHVEIDNGDDVVSCSSVERALDEMFEVDDERIIVQDHNDNPVGWIRLVYGNCGWDVIADYSDNEVTRKLVAGAEMLAHQIANEPASL